MKKIKIIFTSITLLCSLTQVAYAEDKKNYAEIGYGWVAYEEAGWKLVPRIVNFTLGTKVHENIALEGMGAIGVWESSMGGVTLKVDSVFGAYVKPLVNLGENAELFGKLGFTRVSLTASSSVASASNSESDFSYGGGAAYKFDSSTALVVSYMVYYDKHVSRIFGASTGLRFDF